MSANITLCNDGDAKITTIPLCNILTAHKYHKHWNILHVDDYTLATTLYDSASLVKWNFYSIFTSILIITTELYLHSDAYNMDLCKLQTKFSIFITTELSLIQDSLWDNNLQQSLRNCILYINGITTL